MSELHNYFERVVVINLERRLDRWEKFRNSLAQVEWPFKEPERFSAVDGDAVTVPIWWKQGGGAWGCLMSHARILEDCLRDRVKNVLILEDDAVFADNFDQKVASFLEAVPTDWDQIYLGGQHLRDPEVYNEQVYRCINVNRTHCHAINRKFMARMYRYIMNARDYIANPGHHIDHRLGALHESGTVKVYSPIKWLVGQHEDRSDISGRANPTYFWNTWAGVDAMTMTVVLDLHEGYGAEIAGLLREGGIHFGHRLGGYREPYLEDEGLAKICENVFPFPRTERCLEPDVSTPQIYDWCRLILQEASDYGTEGAACYPHLCRMYEDFSRAWQHLKVICVDTPLKLAEERMRARSKRETGWLRISDDEVKQVQCFLYEGKAEWLQNCEHMLVHPERLGTERNALQRELSQFVRSESCSWPASMVL